MPPQDKSLVKPDIQTIAGQQIAGNALPVEASHKLTIMNRGHLLIGNSPAIKAICEQILKIAPTNLSVLIQGESGTGKEVLADMIHNLSLRRDNAIVKISCAAIPETLLESELFGYERGAFTGAKASKPGKFELADGGTLFLDEIAEMSPQLQAKLLRVLQDGRFQRLGGVKDVQVNVRVISATHVDIRKAIAEGKFREDLFYRLKGQVILMPPLRDRPEDILLLAESFLKEAAAAMQKKVRGFTSAAVDKLLAHSWPGNVRELENAIKLAAAVCVNDTIDAGDLDVDFINAKLADFPLIENYVGRNLDDTKTNALLHSLGRLSRRQHDVFTVLLKSGFSYAEAERTGKHTKQGYQQFVEARSNVDLKALINQIKQLRAPPVDAVLPLPSAPPTSRGIVTSSHTVVYIAAPYGNVNTNGRVAGRLRGDGFFATLPTEEIARRKLQEGKDGENIRAVCMDAIKTTDHVVVHLDTYGLDTAWEIGYAEGLGKEIIGLNEDPHLLEAARTVRRKLYAKNFMHGWEGQKIFTSIDSLAKACENELVYVAGSFRNPALEQLEKSRRFHDSAKKVFFPRIYARDKSVGDRTRTNADLEESSIVVIVLPRYGMDTSWQIGFATAKEKQLVGIMLGDDKGRETEQSMLWDHWMHDWNGKTIVYSLNELCSCLRSRNPTPPAAHMVATVDKKPERRESGSHANLPPSVNQKKRMRGSPVESDTLSAAKITELEQFGWSQENTIKRLMEYDVQYFEGISAEHEGTLNLWLKKWRDYPDTGRILFERRGEGWQPIGYWSFVSLSKQAFELVKEGKLLDSMLYTAGTDSAIRSDENGVTMVPCDLSGKHNMYLISICLDKKRWHTKAFLMLFHSFFDALTAFARDGVFFTEVAVHAFTERGQYYCNQFGMEESKAHVTGKGRVFYMKAPPWPTHDLLASHTELIHLYDQKFGEHGDRANAPSPAR
jgi:DNA-binding NtrC family response regulator/nucleoside 2-deoxyribosyltransferase